MTTTPVAVSVVVTAGDQAEVHLFVDALRPTLDAARTIEVLVVAAPTPPARTGGRRVVPSSRALPPGVRMVPPRAARTSGARRNVGAAAASHDVLLFVDAVLDLRPGWLDALVAALCADPATGAVAGQIVRADGRLVQAGGRLVDDHRRGGLRPVARWFGEEPSRPGASVAGTVAVAGGALLAVDRAAFETAGRFDETYRRGLDDADLCLRLGAIGRSVRYEPGACAVVRGRSDVARPWTDADDARRFAARWAGVAVPDVVVRTDGSVLPGLAAADAPARDVAPATGGGPAVRVVGSLFGYHSLAKVNRELAVRFEAEHGLRCDPAWPEVPETTVAEDPRLEPIVRRALLGPLERADVTVQHAWPPSWIPPADGSAWVVIQPWEFGCLPEAWVPPLRDLVDQYWVPSDWIRRCAIRSGVPARKIRVISNGVDTDRLRPDGDRFPLRTTARTRLLFVGGAIRRKGIDVLVDSYLRAFTADDDVCLVLKLSGGASFYKGSLDERLRSLAARDDVPAIEIVEDGLTNDQVADLYRACTVLVHPYRGEGFGMPIAEAMACGLPVVVTGRGAALDFCDAEVAFLVPAVDVTIDAAAELGAPAGEYWLAEPDRAELVRLLRHVHDHPDEAARVGEAGRRRVVDQLDWTRIARVAAGHLVEVAGRTPFRLDPLRAFDPEVAPVALDRPRATTVLLDATGGDLATGLAAWLDTFDGRDDVTLVVVVSTEADLAMVAERAATSDADVLVVPADGDDAVAAAYAACDLVLDQGVAAPGRAIRMARRLVASDAGPDALRGEVLAPSRP